jgi:hypothetical protein
VDVVLGLLAVAAVFGMVVWNHKNAEEALEGIEFELREKPDQVIAALHNALCGGTKARVKSMVSGLKVTPTGHGKFHFESRIGDEGEIEVRSSREFGTVVKAYTTELYVGTHPSSHFKSGFYHLAARMAHFIYKLLGIAPNAARMKRFQLALQDKVARQLYKSAAG